MQEELNLSSLIEVIWNQKIKVITISVIAALVAGLLSLFVLPKTYQATAVVSINNDVVEGVAVAIASSDINSFVEQLKSSFTANKVLRDLTLEGTYSIANLLNHVTIENVKDTRTILIKVKGSNKRDVTSIANQFTKELGFAVEVSHRLDLISTNKKSLNDTSDKLTVTQEQINEANKQLSQTPEFLITKKSLSNDSFMQSIIKDDTGLTNKAVGSLQMSNQEPNPVYTEIKSKLVELSLSYAKLQEEIKTLEKRNTDNQVFIQEGQASTKDNSLLKAVVIIPAMDPIKTGPKVTFNIALVTLLTIIISSTAFIIKSMRATK
jgi:capsular polysaccharide biosynthesis protein